MCVYVCSQCVNVCGYISLRVCAECSRNSNEGERGRGQAGRQADRQANILETNNKRVRKVLSCSLSLTRYLMFTEESFFCVNRFPIFLLYSSVSILLQTKTAAHFWRTSTSCHSLQFYNCFKN